MKSKSEIIRESFRNLRVLDIGGCGYEGDNPYERDLRAAWSTAAKRTTLDMNPRADIVVDLNQRPLPALEPRWDIGSLLDVLEHLEAPVDILRWIPVPRIVVSLPNGLSWFARRMEERGHFSHLYSFTPYTGEQLLASGGWRVTDRCFTFGKWSVVSRLISATGSLAPALVGTGIVFVAERNAGGRIA